MHFKVLGFLLCIISFSIYGQENSEVLQFKTKFYDGVDHWVVFPKAETDSTYPLGFIYIDRMAGITFNYESNILLVNEILVDTDTSSAPKTNMMKYRLASNTKNVHVLNQKQIEQLNLPSQPDWLSIYKSSAKTDDYKIDIASILNGVGGSTKGLEILKEVSPENKNLSSKYYFELGYAYNALKMYDESKPILLDAIKKFPNEELLYKELTFAQGYLNDMEGAEQTFNTYDKVSKNKRYRTEMAYNIAYLYFTKKDKSKFKEWSKISLKTAEKNSQFAQYLVQMEAELDKL